MNILLTGATGLIGRALIPYLIKNKNNITALSRSPEQARKVLPTGINIIPSLLSYQCFDEFDAVVNLAGEPIFARAWSEKQKAILISSRIQLTHQLVERVNCSVNPPKTFISGSATGFYGDAGNVILDEQSSSGEGFAAALSQQWEEAALAANTRVCLLRTGLVLSTQGGALAKMLPLYQYGLGGKLGNGKQYWPWIHIDDMVRAILFLLEHPTCQGAFNLVAPSAVRNADFSRQLAKMLHRPHFAIIPAFMMRVILGERASLLLDSQNVIPAKLLKAGFQFNFAELPSALQDLLAD